MTTSDDRPSAGGGQERAAQRPRRPGALASFSTAFPDVGERYRALADAAAGAGPLDAAGVALVKFAVSVGLGSSRSVHVHARKAIERGVDPQALAQIVAVSLPTLGLPRALDAWRWLEEILDETGSR